MAKPNKLKYLILTFNVCNMGGGQLYVLRRANYLRERGYDVSIVVTFDNGFFPLEKEFRGFPIFYIPEIGRCILELSEKKINEIIDGLRTRIGVYKSLLIESHTLQTAEWGEFIAYKLRGKHLIYTLAEPQVKRYIFNPGKRIFYDKLEKGQFYGCSSMSLYRIFGKDIKKNRYVNIGYDENELTETCVPDISYLKGKDDFVITTVTRLDKLYVEPLINDTILLAKEHSEKEITLIIAGGSKTPGREEYLFTTYSSEKLKLNNLHVIFTGYIKNLGKDIFRLTDVFVGMGTASINAISQYCISINIDPTNNLLPASGIFGVDTNNFAYSENGKHFSIIEKLEEVYKLDHVERKRIQEIGRKLFEDEFELNACFNKLDQAFESIDVPHDNEIFKISWVYRIIMRVVLKLKDAFLFFYLKRWRK